MVGVTLLKGENRRERKKRKKMRNKSCGMTRTSSIDRSRLREEKTTCVQEKRFEKEARDSLATNDSHDNSMTKQPRPSIILSNTPAFCG